jgi:hypothetical protein
METHPEAAKLRNILALKRLEMPLDTGVDRFLIEFHRRQRAQLLVPASPWTRFGSWVQEKVSGLSALPTYSYAGAFAAIVVITLVGFSQPSAVTPSGTRASTPGFAFHLLAPHDGTLAMLPALHLTPAVATTTPQDEPNFAAKADTATRFVLAKPLTSEATVAAF